MKIIGKLFIILAMAAALIAVFYNFAYVPPVLMYHNIDEHSGESKLSVSPESFERQIRYFRQANYNVISAGTLAEYFRTKKKIPFKTVVVTFDDGRKNNYTNAFPVLKKYRVPATVFISPGLVGTEGYMTWDEIREMSAGGVDFGSHTISHAWLPGLKPEEAAREIAGSKKMIEKEIGKSVETMAYCAGGFTGPIQEMVRQAGYKAAFATSPGKKYPDDNPLAIKRLRISNTSDNLFVFAIESSGIYQFVKEWRDDD